VDDDPEPIKKLIYLLELHELYFGKTEPGENIFVDNNKANEIQKALKKLGFYEGDIDGSFSGAAKKAYDDFCGIENFEERMLDGDFVDKKVLEFLMGKAKNA
jgi:uncharacterized Ntn-hydrolase superfamily protein